jgi:hypothetical protein
MGLDRLQPRRSEANDIAPASTGERRQKALVEGKTGNGRAGYRRQAVRRRSPRRPESAQWLSCTMLL